MARNTELQLRKEADIKAEFKLLIGTKRMRYEDAVVEVAHKFYLTPNTVQRIYWGEYDNRRTARPESGAALSN